MSWRAGSAPDVDRFDSGVPAGTAADAMVTAVQPLFSLAMIILSIVTVEPLGWSGSGLWGSCLLIVNGLMALSRTVPDRVINGRGRLLIAAGCAVPAGLLFAHSPGSFGISFAFMLAVHAGVRFEPAVAVAISAATGVTIAVVLAVDHRNNWWVGVFVIMTVTFGMLRRNREQTLRAAHELVEQTRRTAASEARAQSLAERARMARDVHDVLAHSLSGVNMQLSMADALFDAGRIDQGRDAVRQAQGMVVAGLGEARRAVQALREDIVELVPAIRGMLSGDAERVDIVGTAPDLESSRAWAILRTVQEGLTNARRHAPGAPVLVSLRFAADVVLLQVTNGPVDAPASTDGSGLGLIGMRERAALVGATVTAGPITSGEFAGGWQVSFSLPVPAVPGSAEQTTMGREK